MSDQPPISLKGLPSVRQLRAFVAVYQSGHLSSAADMLSVTQPAITVLLRDLEEKLGVRLFDRTTRTLRRTEAAAEAIAYAERVLMELDEMGRSMSDLADTRRGRLRIAATSTVAQTILPQLLGRFLEQHPNVKPLIDDCAPAEFVERIASERVDCGVGTLEAPVPGFEERVFLHDALVAAATARPDFPAGKSLTWKQLAAYPLITVKPGYGVRRRIDRAAMQADVTLRIEYEVSLLTTALALAAGGLGVAVVPGSLMSVVPYPGLVWRPLIRPRIERNTAVIYKKDRVLPKVAEAFIRMLSGQPTGRP